MTALEDLAHALAAGTTTAVALAKWAFARAQADPSIFTSCDERLALATAGEADRLRAAGDPRPLLGIPITIKDNFDLAGYPTTAGSVVLAQAEPAAVDAVTVARLRAAGMVVLGRTAMTEFAFSGLGLNPHGGTPLNPAFPDERRITGGSSSGAAASVARRLVPVALGTDTGGSIRIPAAFCGLVGFKSTARSISREGVLPLSTSLDSVGIIATSTGDCGMIFDVVRDASGAERQRPDKALHFGVVTNLVREGEEAYVSATFEAALARLAAAGARLSMHHVPALEQIPAIAPRASFSAVEAAIWHRNHLAEGRAPLYDPRVLARILPGAEVEVAEIAAMAQRRAAFVDAFSDAAAPFDALIWPTAPMVAPLLDELADDACYHAANLRALRNSTIANLADGCAISLPCHEAGAPPVGLTLAAAGGGDDELLAVASIVETLLLSH